jgi:hypothetical protein
MFRIRQRTRPHFGVAIESARRLARRWIWGAFLSAAAFSAVSCGKGADDGNFSQHPGFAEWYAANPPSERMPSAEQQALLARYQPRIFIAEGQEEPIDFYRDYIAQGRLYHSDGELISAEVIPDILNAHKADPAVVFVHEPTDRATRPRIYGRVDHGSLALPGCEAATPVVFLTYHLVFRRSGLPAGMAAWHEALVDLVSDPADWHQLDHYTALTLALAPGVGGGLEPFAATFQQHNYLRTYLLGATDGPGRLAMPADGRLSVDVALRSNELYPHRPARTSRRAVSFLRPETAGYLITGGDPPWLVADDVTDPDREITPELAFLRPSDAFYVFQGWLGERRWLPGRDGPPGADYNTLPAFKPKPVQLALFYWREDDGDYRELLAELFADGRPTEVPVPRLVERLAADLAPERLAVACATRPGHLHATG